MKDCKASTRWPGYGLPCPQIMLDMGLFKQDNHGCTYEASTNGSSKDILSGTRIS